MSTAIVTFTTDTDEQTFILAENRPVVLKKTIKDAKSLTVTLLRVSNEES